MSGCDVETQGIIIMNELVNSSGTTKAVLLENAGNATVDNSLQVLIVPAKYQVTFRDLGNTFVADRDHGKTNLDNASIKFTWVAQNILEIDYDKKLRIFKKEKKVNGVTVFYKER